MLKASSTILVLSSIVTGCSLFVSLDDLTNAGSGSAIGADGAAGAGDASTVDGGDGAALTDGSQDDGAAPQSCLETDDPSLVAYYPLDETTGTTAHDCSGNGHDGTVSPPTTGGWVAGRFSGGYAFDGISGCIDLGVPPDLLLEGSEFTVAAWAFANSYAIGSGPSSASRYIIGRSAQPNTAGWRLGSDTNNVWDAKYRDNSSATSFVAQSTTGQPTQQWIHVASTFGNGVVTLYVDGVAMAPTQPFTSVVVDTGATVRIGCRSPGDSGYFDGTLDEVRFYNRALSAPDIAALAAKTK